MNRMKRLSLLLGLALALNTVAAGAGVRDAQWKAVDDAMRKGLPKTAITNLEPIIVSALKDKAWGEAAKAIARKIVLEGNVQGNKPEEKIVRLEAEIAKAPRELAPVFDTILAHWYWQYFQQNRWRFLQRTPTASAPGKDFTTWDLPRLFAAIDQQFQKALAQADTLKKTPVTAFDDLLQRGSLPDRYRPTLYDFIVQEALSFYTSGEQAAAQPEDAYELPADSPVFESAEKFMAWHRTFTAKQFPDSPIVKALDLYGRLLAFHQKDADPTAFADVDLARLVYGYNVAFGEEKASRYKVALKAYVDRWADHDLGSQALHHWARVLQQEGDWARARQLALRGKQAHPTSPGAKLCQNLLVEIEARSVVLSAERVSNPPWPRITVRYRNLTNLNFRAVAYDWSEFLDKRHSRPESLNDAGRKELLARAPTLAWSSPLAPTTDFQEHTAELPAPKQLKPGFYFLVASGDPGFGDQDNQVVFTDVWVSDLALLVRPHDRNVEGFVLEAQSGEPIAGAEVMAWHLDNQANRVPTTPGVRTDESGFFSFPAHKEGRGSLLRVRHEVGGVLQELGSMQEYQAQPQPKPEPHSQTVFFTDRALYRPGQAIQYKGICLRVDPSGDNYAVLPGQPLTVVFTDPNGKEIAKAEHQCNDYGSFSGSFIAPRDRLMGWMQIRVAAGPDGATGISVEEYKRPKFRVELEAPKTAARLQGKVNLQGKAESYTGAAVDGALVKWRVVRQVRWPYWWGWHWRPTPRVQGSQEIAHGTSRTETDGTFKIEFTAKPDPAVSEQDEASFNFAVHADVTDTAGETRSADRGVNVGFTALVATLSTADWQTDGRAVELKIETKTLDGEAQVAEGQVKIHRLQEPAQVQRPPLGGGYWRGGLEGDHAMQKDLSSPNNWELAEVVAERGFTTDAKGAATFSVKLGVGAYRAMLETQDRFGKKVTARLPIQVLKPDATRLALKIPNLVAAPTWTLEPGQEFMAVWGTGYDQGRAFVEVLHRDKPLQRFWTTPGRTQQAITQVVTEAMRGGFTVQVTQVRENRAYLESRHVEVPWSNQDLELSWEHFTSKLEPGRKETWTLQIRNPKSEIRNAERAAAELVATLYDKSLEAFQPHLWSREFSFFRRDHSGAPFHFENFDKPFQWLRGQWKSGYVGVDLSYRRFPAELTANLWGYQAALTSTRGMATRDGLMQRRYGVAAPASAMEVPLAMESAVALDGSVNAFRAEGGAQRMAKSPTPLPGVGGGAPAPDLGQVAARKNLNETAFFLPQLTSESNGVVRMTFTMPEALTTWRFMGFAHDRAVRSGYLEAEAVTAKELMVQPNPPRFLREGDTLEFTVKVSNQSTNRQTGKVRLTFEDALQGSAGVPSASGKASRLSSVNDLLANRTPEVAFDVPAKESRSYAWRITVPDGAPFLIYKAVASTGKVSDGEEGYLPVLSRRIFVTESLPLPIRGPATKKFEFTKLLQAGKSDTLRHQGLTVQMVSNPSWYAVMALPYLMEFPHECTEQTFNRLYANALARHIANSDPKIRRVFDQWKETPALDSPLEKNQELKSVLLEETPWLRQAQNERQARQNVGVLFDDHRLTDEAERTLQKLTEQQLPDGAWPWFPGGRGNDYITLYITTGFGRLRHLGVDVNVAPAVKSLARLDGWMNEHYLEIQKRTKPGDYVPSATDALFLYGRSFFLKEQPIAPPHAKAIEFFLAQSRRHWLKTENRQTQGHLAIALKRWGSEVNLATARDILRSIKERSVSNEELGMFWRDTELSWWWYRAPIETQALMIEAFDEVTDDRAAVEDCRVWLLKQKQTQDWKTTKATADAVYALLLRGTDLLASDKLVEVTVGGIAITPGVGRPEIRNQVEPGTGFYEHRFAGSEVKPKLGEITVKKVDEGVAWGSVHWQYLEDLSKVTPYEGTPLKLKKALFVKQNTAKGRVLEPVKGALQVGDELVVRVELRVDRDMEYVHLKDQRGSGTEPVNVLSGYRYQDGLAYYESTRDTASHFFIDYLPKGTYVFEYSTRIQHRGQYPTGVAEIQCMYAPEFNSHSESLMLTVAAGTR